MKWPDASPRHRQSTAEGLTTITLAMVTDQAVAPDPALLRKALRLWAFNTTARRARAPAPACLCRTAGLDQRPLSPVGRPGATPASFGTC